MSSAVLRLIALKARLGPVDEQADVPEDDSRGFFRQVNRFFAPVSVSSAVDMFKELTMTARSPSSDSVLAFIQLYERTERQCEGLRLPESVLVRHFVGALKPLRLSELVSLAEPDTLQQAKIAALREVAHLEHVVREAGRLGHDDRAVGKDRPARTGAHAAGGDARPPRGEPGLGPVRVEGDASLPRRGVPESAPSPRPIICFQCGVAGHKKGGFRV